MATIASEPRLSHSIPRPTVGRTVDHSFPIAGSTKGSVAGSVAVSEAIEHILPLSGCRLRVIDLADGSRMGELYGPSGQWLDEASCEVESHVSGWFGRRGPAGTSWALAFGAGGSHEALEVRFAGLHVRRVVPVVSDHLGLWVAEVSGAFRAATILSSRASSTFRLHYAIAA